MQTSTAQISSPSVPFPRTIQELIRRCTVLAKIHDLGQLNSDASVVLDEISRVMSLAWDMQAQIAAEALPHELRISTTVDHPGYVFINQNGCSYAVPFFMADMLPAGSLLAELNDLSKRVRISPESIMCLSGSGCSLGLEVPIADIDFCEYLKGVDSSFAERFVGAAQVESSKLVCMNIIASPKKRWSRPWSDDVAKPTRNFIEKTKRLLQKSAHKKIDYIANTKSLGVLEVTNKMLAIDFAHGEVGEARHSFSLQEIPFEAGSWVPRKLSDPLEIGRYVNWLIEATKDYLQKSTETPRFAVKSLRRVLPLARVLLARDELRDLRKLLAHENGARLAALQDRCELFGLIGSIDLPNLNGFKLDLKNEILKLRKMNDEACCQFDSLTSCEIDTLDSFAADVRNAVQVVLNRLENRINLA